MKKKINYDEVVVYKADNMAANLSGKTTQVGQKVVLPNITFLSLGNETKDRMFVVILWNTLIRA